MIFESFTRGSLVEFFCVVCLVEPTLLGKKELLGLGWNPHHGNFSKEKQTLVGEGQSSDY